MNILRRAFVALFGQVLFGQQVFRGWAWPALAIQTTQTTGYTPTFTKSGAVVIWKWPDGTVTASNAPNKTFAAGTKKIIVISRDGFTTVTQVNIASLNGAGPLPSFQQFTTLTTFGGGANAFSGALPSFSRCTALVTFACNANSFSGALPSFSACVNLSSFQAGGNGFTGVLPSFAGCTALTLLSASSCGFTGSVAGSFATQKSLATIGLGTNAFTSAAVNQILADCVASLGGGRVACLVVLSGGTSGAPSGQGIIDKAALITAGWTVVTN